MQVKLCGINDLRPYEHNPRINDAAVDAVATSIKEFGFRQPIVVDEQNVIIVGHTRWKAAKKLGQGLPAGRQQVGRVRRVGHGAAAHRTG